MNIFKRIQSLSTKLSKLSFDMAMTKLWDIFYRAYQTSIQRRIDMQNRTYLELPDWLNGIDNSYFQAPSAKELLPYKDIISELAENYLEHRFDILGSGWVKVYHGMKANGFQEYKYYYEENIYDKKHWLQFHLTKENYKESVNILDLIQEDYKSIDWQIDFKSGFRWEENKWYCDIIFGNVPGADIKVPWELGRMQHLPILAYSALLAVEFPKDFKTPTIYFDEFCNEILGFICSNPPKFGVQWITAMDAAIRISNWLVAYDMFKNLGYEFTSEFEKIFFRSIYEHGRFILENLEWSSGMRGNHYLANIVGLVFISAYLPNSDEATLWLAFAIQELIDEVHYQFFQDGTNFEASTYYHRFSTQMVVWAIALLQSLPEDKVKCLSNYDSINYEWKYKRKIHPSIKQYYSISNNKIILPEFIFKYMQKMNQFIIDLLKNDGELPQIGDNDGGKFLKLTPSFIKIPNHDVSNKVKSLRNFIANNKRDHYLFERINDSRDVVSAYAGLTFDDNLIKILKITELDYNILHNCMLTIYNDDTIDKNKDYNVNLDYLKSENIVRMKSYPDFGIYLFDTHYYKATIRCGQIGQKGKGGHAHNDQLSLTLTVNNKKFFVDSGTYIYTGLPAFRNKFRSTSSHNTLIIANKEQNDWLENTTDDLFWLVNEKSRALAKEIGNNHFVGEQFGYGSPHKRKIEFYSNQIYCDDLCEVPGEKRISFHLHPDTIIEEVIDNNKIILRNEYTLIELISDNNGFTISDYDYSPMYGVAQDSKVINIIGNVNSFKWKVEILSI